MTSLSERGVVVWDGKSYRYETEGAWRAKPVEEGADLASLKNLKQLRSTLAVIQQEPMKLFVDLDHLKLEETPQTGVGIGITPEDDDPVVFIHDGGKFYRADQWTAMEPGTEGDAGVVRRRGGVLAAIPGNDIPAGTFCILVNLEVLE